MPKLRRAVLAASPVALLLVLAACGSDAASTASSTPISSPTSTTAAQPAASTSAVPASTAVGQPVPIGQPTTSADGQVTPGPGDTTPGDDGGTPTTAADGAGTATTPGAGTTAPGASPAPTAPPTSAPTSTSDDADDPADPPPSAVNAGTPFCVFEKEIEDKGSAAVDDPAFLAVLASLEPRMTQWVADAPNNEQREAATTLHETTKAAVQAGSVDPFDGDDAVEAMLTVTLFCGATR